MRYAPRVKETTTTTGTGTYELDGAVPGFQTFVDGISGGERTWYCCTNGIDWEIGIGEVTDDAVDTLGRILITDSSNSNNEVDWGAGTKSVFCIIPSRFLESISGDWSEFDPGTNSVAPADNHGSIAIGQQNSISGIKNIAIGTGNRMGAEVELTYAIGNNCVIVEAPVIPSLVFSSGRLTNDGDSQLKLSTVGTETIDATETGLGYFILSGSTPNTGTALYEISVVARQTGGTGGTVGDSKSWKLDCMVTFASGVLAQVGTTVSSVIAASAGASAWACTIDVSNNASGPIRVTGEANETIQWVAYVRAIENSTGYEEPV